MDGLGSVARRQPLLVPLAGEPGTVAAVTTPDGRDGGRALNPGDRYPEWQQAVAARSVMPVGLYSPGKYASQGRCPMLVLVCDQGKTALSEPACRHPPRRASNRRHGA